MKWILQKYLTENTTYNYIYHCMQEILLNYLGEFKKKVLIPQNKTKVIYKICIFMSLLKLWFVWIGIRTFGNSKFANI